jgi:hypothetical protein
MNSSKKQFEEFLQNTVWRDIKDILLLRRSDIRDQLEGGTAADIDVYVEMRETARLRGRAEELRFITDLPNEIVNNYDQYSKEEEE